MLDLLFKTASVVWLMLLAVIVLERAVDKSIEDGWEILALKVILYFLVVVATISSIRVLFY